MVSFLPETLNGALLYCITDAPDSGNPDFNKSLISLVLSCSIELYNIDRTMRALSLVENPCFIRVDNTEKYHIANEEA